jgi:hypothetical protein
MEIIHFVLGKANPDRMNGVNKVANSLCTAQTNLGNDVTVWGITADPTSGYPERIYKTKLFKTHPLRFVLDPKVQEAIDELKGRQVVFHIHGGFIPEFYTLSKMLTKAKIPYLITGHGKSDSISCSLRRVWWPTQARFTSLEKARKVV